MTTVNKVIILGNLGRDPAIHHLGNGRMRVQLTVATHDIHKTKEGAKINHTDWHEVILWTPRAEIAAQYLSKGEKVYIEGKLNYWFYLDKDGQQKNNIQIIGQHLVLLGDGKTKNVGVHALNHRPQNKLHKNDDMSELPL